MARIPERPRKNARLPGYDYSLPGPYFVTIVSKDRELIFDDLRLKAAVEDAWQWLGQTFRYAELDAFVVMPNHVHGVLLITDPQEGRWQAAPTGRGSLKPLGGLVGAFKTNATRRVNETRGTPGLPVWQRNYYERVVRSESELNRIRDYIRNNPLTWKDDPENPGTCPVAR